MLLFSRVFRRFLNGDVVALRHVGPCRRVSWAVNGNVLFVEHLAACESGLWFMMCRGNGLFDRLDFSPARAKSAFEHVFVSFGAAFYEA